MIAAAFPLVRPLLHRLDAERAHDLTLAALALLPAGPRAADGGGRAAHHGLGGPRRAAGPAHHLEGSALAPFPAGRGCR
ncbi:hypothetical protein MMR14E_15950 [Methylobacterium mesophilicum]